MKKIISIIIYLILLSSVASHSNEKNIEIIGESKRAIYMIEVDSVEDAKGEGTYIEFITITSLKKPNKLQDGTNYLSVRTTHIGDCGEKKIKDIKTQFFDRKMKDGDFTKLNLIKTETTIDSFWADAKTIGKVNTAIMNKACSIRFQNIINPKDGDPPAFSLDLLKKTKP